MYSFVFKLILKTTKIQTRKDLLYSDRTLFCFLNVNLFSITLYVKNIKRPEIRSSKGSADFLKKNLIVYIKKHCKWKEP